MRRWVLGSAVGFLFACGLSAQKHEHGKAELGVAVDGTLLKAEFRAPADTILGFERRPRTDQEKRIVAAALEKLRTQGTALLLVPAEFGCRFVPGKADLHVENGGHADVEAEFEAKCARPPVKGDLRFGFSKAFPNLKELSVQLVSASHQTASTIKQDQGVVRLGP